MTLLAFLLVGAPSFTQMKSVFMIKFSSITPSVFFSLLPQKKLFEFKSPVHITFLYFSSAFFTISKNAFNLSAFVGGIYTAALRGHVKKNIYLVPTT